MGPTVKASPVPSSAARLKKSAKSRVVKLQLAPKILRQFPFEAVEIKAEPEQKAPSSTTSNTLPVAASSPGENVSESNSNTPAPSATDGSTSMLPPTELVKKKGPKKSLLTADGLIKPRGKPGPKKRKLEDGTDPITGISRPATLNAPAGHKLGPKANQGAINAGLRALDRSGKPCRKWQKGSFQIKTFTGAIWEIPRWKAPPKFSLNGELESSSSGGSSKENKESSQVDSEKSVSAADVEMASAPSIPASSPAPVTV